jgi:hypothetical protein
MPWRGSVPCVCVWKQECRNGAGEQTQQAIGADKIGARTRLRTKAFFCWFRSGCNLGRWRLRQVLLNLKPTAIDSDRMTVSVNAGKGKKDRVTLMSA